LNSWLEGNKDSDVQHAKSEMAKQIVRLLGRPTPVKHWLVRLLRHKLDLYEKHSGFDRLVRPHRARERHGGTIHMALGRNPIPETEGLNKSALHWDILKDMKKDGDLCRWKLFYKNGRFLEL